MQVLIEMGLVDKNYIWLVCKKCHDPLLTYQSQQKKMCLGCQREFEIKRARLVQFEHELIEITKLPKKSRYQMWVRHTTIINKLKSRSKFLRTGSN